MKKTDSELDRVRNDLAKEIVAAALSEKRLEDAIEISKREQRALGIDLLSARYEKREAVIALEKHDANRRRSR